MPSITISDGLTRNIVASLTWGGGTATLSCAVTRNRAFGIEHAQAWRGVMDHPSPQRRKRVLIVDDCLDVREVWHDWLTIWGFDVDQAENGAEAVAKAMACRPDLVLMDWTMPVLDGLAATERLRAHAATAEVPVLALSADTFAPTPQEALGAGCTSFLGKPVTPECLLNEIRRAFRHEPREMTPGAIFPQS